MDNGDDKAHSFTMQAETASSIHGVCQLHRLRTGGPRISEVAVFSLLAYALERIGADGNCGAWMNHRFDVQAAVSFTST